MSDTPIIRLGGGEVRPDNYEIAYLSTMRKTRQAAGDTDDLSDTLTKGGTMNKTSGRGHTTIPWICQPSTERSSSMVAMLPATFITSLELSHWRRSAKKRSRSSRINCKTTLYSSRSSRVSTACCSVGFGIGVISYFMDLLPRHFHLRLDKLFGLFGSDFQSPLIFADLAQ